MRLFYFPAMFHYCVSRNLSERLIASSLSKRKKKKRCFGVLRVHPKQRGKKRQESHGLWERQILAPWWETARPCEDMRWLCSGAWLRPPWFFLRSGYIFSYGWASPPSRPVTCSSQHNHSLPRPHFWGSARKACLPLLPWKLDSTHVLWWDSSARFWCPQKRGPYSPTFFSNTG